DTHWRRLFLHGANLHRRRVRAQQMRRARAGDVESVHIVARGMMLGNIEGLEIVVGSFDLRPFHHAEADGKENAKELLISLTDQMARADGALDAGKRKVNFVTR